MPECAYCTDLATYYHLWPDQAVDPLCAGHRDLVVEVTEGLPV